MTAAGQAALFAPDSDALTQATDEVLLRDVSDASHVLSIGTGGVGPHTVARLRNEILIACAELERRWERS